MIPLVETDRWIPTAGAKSFVFECAVADAAGKSESRKTHVAVAVAPHPTMYT